MASAAGCYCPTCPQPRNAAAAAANEESWQRLCGTAWAERAGFSEPVGEVDRSRLNVMGGSIAIGHPFGATGARITTTLCNEMQRRGAEFGLMTVCAAGGMGFAMVVEAP